MNKVRIGEYQQCQRRDNRGRINHATGAAPPSVMRTCILLERGHGFPDARSRI